MDHSQTSGSDSFKAAVVFLLLANGVPAFWLEGARINGWMASLLEFWALSAPGIWTGKWVASFLGVIANLGYLATFIARSNQIPRIAQRSARIATLAAFASIIFLAAGSDRFLPLPGCFLWLLTGLALLRATR